MNYLLLHRYPVLFALFTLLAPLWSHIQAESITAHINEVHGITLSYSDQLSMASPSPTGTLLLLTSAQGGYPTLNVIVQPGLFNEPPGAPKEISEKTLNEYRAVGLTDARVLRPYIAPIANTPSLTVEIQYSNNGEQLISAVSYLNNVDRYFIITYIDRAADFYRNKRIREDLVNSIILKAPNMAISVPADEASETPSTAVTRSPLTYFAALISALVVIGVGAALLRRRQSSGTP